MQDLEMRNSKTCLCAKFLSKNSSGVGMRIFLSANIFFIICFPQEIKILLIFTKISFRSLNEMSRAHSVVIMSKHMHEQFYMIVLKI